MRKTSIIAHSTFLWVCSDKLERERNEGLLASTRAWAEPVRGRGKVELELLSFRYKHDLRLALDLADVVDGRSGAGARDFVVHILFAGLR